MVRVSKLGLAGDQELAVLPYVNFGEIPLPYFAYVGSDHY